MRRAGWGLGGLGYEKFLQISQWYWDISILGDNKKVIFLASFNWLVSRTMNWQQKGFFVEHVFLPHFGHFWPKQPWTWFFSKNPTGSLLKLDNIPISKVQKMPTTGSREKLWTNGQRTEYFMNPSFRGSKNTSLKSKSAVSFR